MMKSNAIRALHRAALLRPKAFGIAFLAAVVLVVLATVFWPGGAPLGIPVVGAAAALAIGVLVPWTVCGGSRSSAPSKTWSVRFGCRSLRGIRRRCRRTGDVPDPSMA